MARTKDTTLEAHQRQCDCRYVMWSWLGGILVTLLLAAGGVGWWGSQTLAQVRTDAVVVRDSVAVAATRAAAQAKRIEDLEVRARVLDSLTVWVPRIERATIQTQRLIRAVKNGGGG